MSAPRAQRRFPRWPVVVVVLVVAAGWWLLAPRVSVPGAEPWTSVKPPKPSAPARTGVRSRGGWRLPDAGISTDDSSCAPRNERRCVAGDVHWLDGCGRVGDKDEECASRLCRDGACAAVASRGCRGLPLEGRCDGDVVRGCVGGQPYERACDELGKRCVATDEGAQCRTPSEDDCEHHGPLPRCEGDQLLVCVDGRVRRQDCSTRNALCGELPGRSEPSCHVIEQRDTEPDKDQPCGPCGCGQQLPAADTDTCDGNDNDRDGLVDEQGHCEPIPLLALVLTDAAGNGSYAPEDLALELERVNRVLGALPEGLALQAELVDIVSLRRPQWLELDDGDFAALLRDPAVMAARDTFYVPVVFTDEIASGDTPKVGVSTIPNGRCGGRRVNPVPEPPLGAIAVSKGRAPTTLAHEIGHFFGLCHTHFEYGEAVVRVVRWPVGDNGLAQVGCEPPCVLDGDGICDTPPDPGIDDCSYDDACRVLCTQGASPDPFNVMSYYTACRRELSELQGYELRHGLALRQGFFACRAPGLCPCDPYAPVCPEQMTCRPVGGGFACGVDGPHLPGQACRAHVECGAGAVCANDGKCRVPCGAPSGDEPAADCRCTRDARLGIAVCA